MSEINRQNEITAVLRAWQRGDGAALDRLIPIVYAELRTLARAQLRHETAHHSLQPTALVHETFAAAIALPVAERPMFLDRALADQHSLRREVNELISAHERASSFLNSSNGATLATPTPAPVPQNIGPYRITGVLGRGGMGLVYDAVDERLGRPVAVKVILDHGRASDPARERFRREARVAAVSVTRTSVRFTTSAMPTASCFW